MSIGSFTCFFLKSSQYASVLEVMWIVFNYCAEKKSLYLALRQFEFFRWNEMELKKYRELVY